MRAINLATFTLSFLGLVLIWQSFDDLAWAGYLGRSVLYFGPPTLGFVAWRSACYVLDDSPRIPRARGLSVHRRSWRDILADWV